MTLNTSSQIVFLINCEIDMLSAAIITELMGHIVF